MQLSVHVLFNVGILANITVGLPGVHGVTVAGIHGIGVNTPKAAVVAVATSGFAIEEHIPKVGMFTIGLLSIILAAGISLVITLFSGKTIRVDGATPKEHIMAAPIHTCCGIIKWFCFVYYILFLFQ